MMKGKLKKIVSTVLVFTTAALVFTGCGKKQSEDSASIINNAAQGSKDYVYAQEMLEIAEGDNIQRITYAGDRLYASDYGENKKLTIYSFNHDGSDLKRTELELTDKMNVAYMSIDSAGNIYTVYNIYHWADSGEGDMVTYDTDSEGNGDASSEETLNEGTAESSDEAASETSTEDTTAADTNETDATESSDAEMKIADPEQDKDEAYLAKYDWDGNLIYKVDLVSEFGDEEGAVSTNGLAISDDDKIIVSVQKGIFLYDENSGFKPLVKLDANTFKYYQLYKAANNKIFVSSYGEKGIELCTLDTDNGGLSEPVGCIEGYTDYGFFGGNGYDLYASKSDGIYGLDLTKNELVKLVDYVDSDIEVTSSSSNVVAVSPDEFIALFPDAEWKMYISRLTKIPADQVVDKEVITLAGYYLDYDLRKKAFEFNKNNNQYKIKFVDYSTYDVQSYGEGAEKLNMDIISGNTPDILALSDEMPIDSYINKGLFVDLNTYLNNDKDISASDLLPNILEASKTQDKLYQLVPSFYIGTMAIKEKFTEGKNYISFKDCKNLMDEMGIKPDAAFGITTRDNFLSTGLEYSGNTFIDWENKSCNFNGDSFVEFLEFANTFPEKYPDNVWDTYKDTLYLDDEALFAEVRISEFSQYSYFKYVRFGENPVFVGYPNDFGMNNSVIIPISRIAICAQSKYKDAAWEFIKTLLSEEYQDKLSYGFPIRQSSYDKKAEDSTHRPYYMEGDKKVEYDDEYYIGGQPVIAKPLTAEEVKYMKDFIASLTLFKSSNKNVNNIIFEEASAFFSGQKSAKEVADIIQSRLSIYVNENS